MRRSQVDDDAAWFHGFDHILGDQHRRGAAGDQGGGDDDVSLRHALGHFSLLALQPARRHGLGVTTHTDGGFALFVGFVGHVDEFAAQGFDLLFHARAHVRCFDHSAQTLGGGNGLQAGHANAQDDHAGSFDRSGGCHQHGEKSLIAVGRHHHGLVTGNVGL